MRRPSRGLSWDQNSAQVDLRRDWDHKIYWAKGGQSGMRAGVAHLVAKKTRHVCGVVGAYRVVHFV